jgi:serine/threonine protein kinase
MGIVYRDLKPENVMLGDEGHIKLADFGISKQLQIGEEMKSNSFCGSAEYMSPEMLRPGHHHGKEVDLYSLGAILFEMLVGWPPHLQSIEEKVAREILYRRILYDNVRYPKYLSEDAVYLMQGLLHKNP